jgi:ABC-type transport system involved in cytochrome bd biosynthesis fused ATPase/permease subunit
MFTRAFIQLSNALVSLNRLNEFLLSKDLEELRLEPSESNTAIEIKNFNFSWKKENEFSVENVSLRVNKGELVAFVGPVGSGKVINKSNLIKKNFPCNNYSIYSGRVQFCLVFSVNWKIIQER